MSLPKDSPISSVILPLLVVLALVIGFAGDATVTRAGHLMELTHDLQSMAAGQLLVHGPELGHTGLSLGGGLFTWLHLPARLLADPVLGLHLCYAGYQALALALFVLLARRARIDQDVTWLAALLIAASPAARSTILENGVLATDIGVVALGVMLLALARPCVGWAFTTGAVLGLAICVHLLSALPLAGAVVAFALARPHRTRRLGALATGVAVTGGAGVLLDLAAPTAEILAYASPPPSSPGDLSAVLCTPGLLGLYLTMLPGLVIPLVGAVIAAHRALRKPDERPQWLGVLAWLAVSLALAALTAPAAVSSLSRSADMGRPLLKFELVGLAPAALLGALALAEVGHLFARRGWVVRTRGLLSVMAGLAILTVPLARWVRAPAPAEVPPEPFFRSAADVASLARHLAPYRAAGLAERVCDPLRLAAFDAPTRLLALWRPDCARGGAPEGDTVLVPASDALVERAPPGAYRAGAMLAIPGCRLLALESCGDEAWCGDWPSVWESDGLVLLMRFGRDVTLTPGGGSPLPSSPVVLDASWSQAGSGGHDFQWLALAVHRGAGPGPVRIEVAPVGAPPMEEGHTPSIRYLYSVAERPSLRAWLVPLGGGSGG